MKLHQEKLNDVTVITMLGSILDADNSGEFKNQMLSICRTENRLIFDMSEIQFVDSSGIGAILTCLRSLNSEGGDLKLCRLTAPVRGLFELVRLHKVLDIFNTPDEAVLAF